MTRSRARRGGTKEEGGRGADGKRSWTRAERATNRANSVLFLLVRRGGPAPRVTETREGRNAARVRLTMKGRGGKTRKNATRKKEKKKKKTTTSSERGKLRVSAPRRQNGPHTSTSGSQITDTLVQPRADRTPATSARRTSYQRTMILHRTFIIRTRKS